MALDWIRGSLDGLERDGLLRPRRAPTGGPGAYVELEGHRLLNLCSNDYLSLAAGPPVVSPTGAGASRLVGGHQKSHAALERALADWLGYEDALVFSSGYAANVGAIGALADRDTLVVSDAQNHASIVDGCRLSRARVVVVPHLDLSSMERAFAGATERRRLLVTDGYFSMDGDVPPLDELRALCERHRAALYVDEAHALGVLGPEGRGAAAAAGVRPDVFVGTFGKSFGAAGAFVAGSAELVRWLWNRARSFVFSTGLSPSTTASVLARLPALRSGERTARVLEHAETFRRSLAQAGVPVMAGSVGPIIPVVLGEPQRAVVAAHRLLDRGCFVHPMRPPTVPPGTSRLRLTVQADHDPDDLRRATSAIAEAIS
jgi:8-amino-7-oxononanoate synthase